MRVAAVLVLLLSGCGPVRLGEESRAHDAGAKSSPVAVADADAPDASQPDDDEAAAFDASTRPSVSVSVRSIECGRCFDLQAEGFGGLPPYEFQWEDNSTQAKRRVCVENAEVSLTLFARDAASVRSETQTIRLEGLANAACPAASPPVAATPPSLLCLENPSFEGTPVPNLGQTGGFEAGPWTVCTNPGMPAANPNTPALANETIVSNFATPPKAMDGTTYLALGEGQQVSQPFCSTIDAGAPVSFELDLSRIDVSEGLVPQTEQVFLEIWGGLAVDCSQRELLWASPALTVGWKRYCVTLHPHSFLNQITLRANADMTLPSAAYLLVDNLKPMDKCP